MSKMIMQSMESNDQTVFLNSLYHHALMCMTDEQALIDHRQHTLF